MPLLAECKAKQMDVIAAAVTLEKIQKISEKNLLEPVKTHLKEIIHIHELKLNQIVLDDQSGQLPIVNRISVFCIQGLQLFQKPLKSFGEEQDNYTVIRVYCVYLEIKSLVLQNSSIS